MCDITSNQSDIQLEKNDPSNLCVHANIDQGGTTVFGNKNTTKVVYQYLSKKPTHDAENVGLSVACDCVPYFFCFIQ